MRNLFVGIAAAAFLMFCMGQSTAQTVEETVHFINGKIKCGPKLAVAVLGSRINTRSDGKIRAERRTYRSFTKRIRVGKDKKITVDYGHEAASARLFDPKEGRFEIHDNYVNFRCEPKKGECVQINYLITETYPDRKTASLVMREYRSKGYGGDNCRANANAVICDKLEFSRHIGFFTCDKDTTERVERALNHLRKVLKPRKQLF